MQSVAECSTLCQGAFVGKRKKTGHISLWVEPEFKKMLEDYAVTDGRSLSNLVQKILEDWLKSKVLGREGEPYEEVEAGKRGA